MTSREKILSAIKTSQPAPIPLPSIDDFLTPDAGSLEKFTAVLEGIGGKVYRVTNYEEINTIIQRDFIGSKRIVTSLPQLVDFASIDPESDPHLLENIDLAILEGEFAVAENGAVWLTEKRMVTRVLPFISQYLAVVIEQADILPYMHHAYQRISNAEYGFAAFIAGPSKTADIEQSLVLGAHGPKGMTIFVLDNP